MSDNVEQKPNQDTEQVDPICQKIKNDIELLFAASETDKNRIMKTLEDDLDKLLDTLSNNEQEALKLYVIYSGIVENLLTVIDKSDLNTINRSFSQLLLQLSYNQSQKIIQTFIKTISAFPGIIRLLDHIDIDIVEDGINTILYIIQTGIKSFKSDDDDDDDDDDYDEEEKKALINTFHNSFNIERIFSMFQRADIQSTDIINTTAITMGYLISNDLEKTKKHIIVESIKKLLNDEDDWTKNAAKDVLCYMANDSEIINEILEDDFLSSIARDLQKPFEGNENQKLEIIKKQERGLQIVNSMVSTRSDEEFMKCVMNSGVVEDLLNIFQLRQIEMITKLSIGVFSQFSLTKDTIKQLLVDKQPFPGLCRLLSHPEVFFSTKAVVIIFNIINAEQYSYDNTQTHPLFEALNSCDGREIDNLNMRDEIIQHITDMFNADDKWSKTVSFFAFQGLIKNEVNRSEFLKGDLLRTIVKDLQSPIEGTEEEQKATIKRQGRGCQIIYQLLDDRQDDSMRWQMIDIGIVDALLNIFEHRALDEITLVVFLALFVFVWPYSITISQYLIEKKTFPILIRLFDCLDENVVSESVNTINNILQAGALGSDNASPHPYYDDLISYGGIEQIFSLFKRSISEHCRINCAISISVAHRALKIENEEMKIEIIKLLKEQINHKREDLRKEIKVALRCLALNPDNISEIEKDGFIIPE
ncbi:MAG: hypothetical protein EZS28_005964 [Streblomastix strix]|uniref:Uncharacterized protein n=1 Tax=Streblomastix strix TaxID=222440 RepID=A0A5J4WTZ3_9EUKA|nr:MAG: hypothetical protein EZS28_005964 [Streblomastix strix]